MGIYHQQYGGVCLKKGTLAEGNTSNARNIVINQSILAFSQILQTHPGIKTTAVSMLVIMATSSAHENLAWQVRDLTGLNISAVVRNRAVMKRSWVSMEWSTEFTAPFFLLLISGKW
jgi:hypothetical protein